MKYEDIGITEEQVTEIAKAAGEAAMKKTEELGLPFMYHILGIERLWDATEMTMKIFDALGDKIGIFAEALKKAEAYDMHKEAEEVLRNGD